MPSIIGFARSALTLGLVLALGGAAVAVTSNAFKYTTPQRGWLMIDTSELEPEATNAHSIAFSRSAIFFRAEVAEDGGSCFMASIDVPQGAKLLRAVSYLSSDVHADPFFRIIRVQPAADSFNNLLFKTFASNSGERRSVSAPVEFGARVDNSKYQYLYNICLGHDDLFFGARVDYEFTAAGD